MESRKWGEPTYDYPVETISIGACGKFSRAIPYDFQIGDLKVPYGKVFALWKANGNAFQ